MAVLCWIGLHISTQSGSLRKRQRSVPEIGKSDEPAWSSIRAPVRGRLASELMLSAGAGHPARVPFIKLRSRRCNRLSTSIVAVAVLMVPWPWSAAYLSDSSF